MMMMMIVRGVFSIRAHRDTTFIILLGYPPSFKERITCFLVFSLLAFSKFLVDSFVAGASKTQEEF